LWERQIYISDSDEEFRKIKIRQGVESRIHDFQIFRLHQAVTAIGEIGGGSVDGKKVWGKGDSDERRSRHAFTGPDGFSRGWEHR
jgi:hypothetical protein